MNTLNPSQSASVPASANRQSGDTVTDLKAVAAEKVQQAKDAAAATATRTKAEAEHFATEQKTAAAKRVSGYSTALHESAKALEEKDPNIAWLAQRAADRIGQVADYVRNREFRDLRADAEDLARRHPGAFFGGLFVTGLILGNVMKSSSRNRWSREKERGDDSSDWSTHAAGDAAPAIAGGV